MLGYYLQFNVHEPFDKEGRSTREGASSLVSLKLSIDVNTTLSRCIHLYYCIGDWSTFLSGQPDDKLL